VSFRKWINAHTASDAFLAGSCSFGKRNFRLSGSKLHLSPSTKELNSPSFRDFFSLVGGFHPFEKYARQIGSFPQVGEIKNI